MRRTKRGRKAQVSREGGKGELGGGGGRGNFIGCPEIALRAFQRPYDKN